MNNFNKPQIAYTEMKLKVLITDIEKKADKNGKDYWILKTFRDNFISQNYFVFSSDYSLSPGTLSILTNSADKVLNKAVILTIRKVEKLEKVIAMEICK